MDKKKITVYKENGDVSHYVNPFLLEKQDCWGNVDKIKQLHYERMGVYEEMKKTNDKLLLKMLDGLCTQIEFELQELWGFSLDIRYHRFWARPKCTCPKLDNEDLYPGGLYVTSGLCHLHGWME